jgi:hypothetical protein
MDQTGYEARKRIWPGPPSYSPWATPPCLLVAVDVMMASPVRIFVPIRAASARAPGWTPPTEGGLVTCERAGRGAWGTALPVSRACLTADCAGRMKPRVLLQTPAVTNYWPGA